MSNLGLGVMIAMLGGDHESNRAVNSVIGKTIAAISMTDEIMIITLVDGRSLTLKDDGQSCCEHRYMTCDDDLTGFEGATLVSVETRDAPSLEDRDGDSHDVQFLVIKTSKGDVTAETHNEHNGYYGGFAIQARITGGAP